MSSIVVAPWDEDKALAQVIEIGANGIDRRRRYGDFFLGMMFSERVREAARIYALIDGADYVHLEQLVKGLFDCIDTSSARGKRRVLDGYYDGWLSAEVISGAALRGWWPPTAAVPVDGFNRVPSQVVEAVLALDDFTGNRKDLKRPLAFLSTEQKERNFVEDAVNQVFTSMGPVAFGADTISSVEVQLRKALVAVGLEDIDLSVEWKESSGTVEVGYRSDTRGHAVRLGASSTE